MEFLYLLEKIRTPFGDWLLGTLTHLGAETLFIVAALLFFWCLDKKKGYYLLFTGLSGVLSVQILKMACRIPRPWVLDPDFTIVESAREGATGYSFPSGHTQCATGVYGSIARSHRNWIVRAVSIAILVTVAFSRMYLGVHTPKDVLVSLGIGLFFVFALYPILDKAFPNPLGMLALFAFCALFALANLLFVELYAFPADVDAANLLNAKETAWKLLAAILGMLVAYLLDHYLVHFEVTAVWWVQIIKIALGVGSFMLLRILLKQPCNALLGEAAGGGLRYFLLVVWSGGIYPMLFPLLNKLDRKKAVA